MSRPIDITDFFNDVTALRGGGAPPSAYAGTRFGKVLRLVGTGVTEVLESVPGRVDVAYLLPWAVAT